MIHKELCEGMACNVREMESVMRAKLADYLIEQGIDESSADVVELDPSGSVDEYLEEILAGRSLYPTIQWKGEIVGTLDGPRLFRDMISHNVQKDTLIFQALDSIQEGICICDKNGFVRVWNKAIEAIYGITSKEILGRHLDEFFTDAADIRVLKTEQPMIYQAHSPKPGADILISAAPIYSRGELVGVVSTDRRLQDVILLSEKLNEAIRFIEVLEKQIEKESITTADFFVGTNHQLREQLEIAIRAAKTDVPILITGETGTGKEVFSRFVHKRSELKGKFVPVNCSAIPEALFESEFFGYEKGAFTGADREGRAGYFEQADGGTLFLDEVSELPLPQQTKLLRAIQEGKVRRLGSTKEIPVQVRLVSASNSDLEELVKTKEFRIDFYYRLKGISIELPPLRERVEDLEAIISHFLHQISGIYNEQVDRISLEALNVLKAYDWPGNVRELKNVLRQMVVMAAGSELTVREVPDDVRCAVLGDCWLPIDQQMQLTLSERVDNFEKELIIQALYKAGGNIAQAAQTLSIPRTTLQYRIKKLEIETNI